MKKHLTYFLSVTFISIFIFPSISFASWWNPLSWFKPVEVKVRQEIVVTPTPSTTIISTTTPVNSPISPEVKNILQKISKPNIPTKLTNSQIIKNLKPSVVYIETQVGSGSGMIISSDGYVLTNAHVVTGSNSVEVSIYSGDTFFANVVGINESEDLAVLKINSQSSLPYVVLGDSDKVEQGDEVFTLGFPFGIKGDVSFKEGTVSRKIGNYFEISAEIHPGNSGGPLVNRYGQVIGINSASYGDSIGKTQIGETIKLAIRINIAKLYLPQLKRGESVIKKQISTEEICPVLIAEQKLFSVTKTVQLEFKSDKIINSLTSASHTTSGDFVQVYNNFVNIRDDITKLIDDSKNIINSLTYKDYKYLDLNKFTEVKIAYNSYFLTLEHYYKTRLTTLYYIINNRYMDDYMRIKIEDMLKDDSDILQKAVDYHTEASSLRLKILADYGNLMSKYECKF